MKLQIQMVSQVLVSVLICISACGPIPNGNNANETDPLKIQVITSATQHPDLPQIQIPGLELKVFAGIGKAGYKDGSKLEAEFNTPAGMTKDLEGNLYVADNLNNRIRKISLDGQVSTFAGGGKTNLIAEKLLESDIFSPKILQFFPPNIIFVIYAYGVLEIYLDKYVMKQFLSDKFGNTSLNIVYYKNNIYISLFHKIQKITKMNNLYDISDYAGTDTPASDISDDPTRYFRDGSAQIAIFNSPTGLAFDSTGNLYVADSLNQRIRKIDATTQVVTTFAGDAKPEKASPQNGRPGLEGGYIDGDIHKARFNLPSELVMTSTGQLLVQETGNQTLRMISGNQVITLIKNISGSLFLDNQILYLSDYKRHRIYTLDISKLPATRIQELEKAR